MGIPVLIIGKSGSGKTYSVKGYTQDKIGFISIEKGRLSFKSDLKVVKIPKYFKEADGSEIVSYARLNAARYAWIENILRIGKVKTYAIDDSQYLLLNEMLDRSSEKGYDKFTDIAKNFRNLVHYVNESIDDDKIVFFLHHSETGQDNREKCKTIGKMLEEKVVIEGLFDVVLYCSDHKFYTQSNETSTAKTPEGMFESVEIPNCLMDVEKAIRDYWNLGGD